MLGRQAFPSGGHVTLPPIIMEMTNGCISNSSSIPFKYSHYPLNRDYGRKSNLCNLSVGVPSIFSKLLTASGRFGDVVPRVLGVRHRKCCLGTKTFPWSSGVGDSNMVKWTWYQCTPIGLMGLVYLWYSYTVIIKYQLSTIHVSKYTIP